MSAKIYHRLEEFKELIWDDYISEYSISNSYINRNSDFLDEVTFILHRLHQKSNGEFSIQIAARALEGFLITSFHYKPEQVDVGKIENLEEAWEHE